MKMTKLLAFLSLAISAATVAQTPKAVPSISADIEVVAVATLSDGNQLEKSSTQRFFRDSQGRTRLENGNTVTINDVVRHEVLILDLAQHTIQKVLVPASAPTSVRSAAAMNVNTGTQTLQGASLGIRNINGFDAEGKETTTTIPANSSLGNKLPIQRTTRIWHSSALQLPLVVEIQDPLHGHIMMQYKNLQAGALLDPVLFEAPPDFTIVKNDTAAKVAPSGHFPKP